MPMPQHITNWFAADTALGKRDRRKVANNTYLFRAADNTIHLRLHETDVVVYHPNGGGMTLDTGGWFTVTTKDRINAALPGGFRIYSVKGNWFLHRNIRDLPDVPFVDRMTLWPDGEIEGIDWAQVQHEIDARTKLKQEIAAFVRGITADAVVTAWENTGGDCLLCRVGQTRCLGDHVEERYFHATLAHNAVRSAGFHSPEAIMAITYDEAKRGRVDTLLTSSLRKYLKRNLISGSA